MVSRAYRGCQVFSRCHRFYVSSPKSRSVGFLALLRVSRFPRFTCFPVKVTRCNLLPRVWIGLLLHLSTSVMFSSHNTFELKKCSTVNNPSFCLDAHQIRPNGQLTRKSDGDISLLQVLSKIKTNWRLETILKRVSNERLKARNIKVSKNVKLITKLTLKSYRSPNPKCWVVACWMFASPLQISRCSDCKSFARSPGDLCEVLWGTPAGRWGAETGLSRAPSRQGGFRGKVKTSAVTAHG